MLTLSPEMMHSEPRVVPLKRVEDELGAQRETLAAELMPGSMLLRACTLTLVVLCDRREDPAELEPLVARVVESNPARVILIAQHRSKEESSLETRVSTYVSARHGSPRLVGEEIAFYPRGAQYDTLHSAVLALRVSGLPFVLYWRGQPDLEDRLFHALVGECDQILFDSQRFTARAERVNNTIARLRLDYPHVSFGDINWQRIRPWREMIAQFFDDPANLEFLDMVTRVEIEFSVAFGGNQSAAILLMAWLASSLGWRVEPGSYQREGVSRRARFERHPYGSLIEHPLQVTIRVRDQPDCMPGELTGVRLEMDGDPPEVVFALKRAVGGFVDVRELTPNRFSERCNTLQIPQESAVITAELDAPRRDRNYHRALELLDALVAQSV